MIVRTTLVVFAFLTLLSPAPGGADAGPSETAVLPSSPFPRFDDCRERFSETCRVAPEFLTAPLADRSGNVPPQVDEERSCTGFYPSTVDTCPHQVATRHGWTPIMARPGPDTDSVIELDAQVHGYYSSVTLRDADATPRWSVLRSAPFESTFFWSIEAAPGLVAAGGVGIDGEHGPIFGRIEGFDAADGSQRWVTDLSGGGDEASVVRALRFTPDGTKIVAVGEIYLDLPPSHPSGSPYLMTAFYLVLDAETGVLLHYQEDSASAVYDRSLSLDLSTDGKTLYRVRYLDRATDDTFSGTEHVYRVEALEVATGAVVWQDETVVGIDTATMALPMGVEALPDGAVLITGSESGGDVLYFERPWARRVDAMGEKVWERSWPSATGFTHLHTYTVSDDGETLWAVMTESFSQATAVRILRIATADGSQVWEARHASHMRTSVYAATTTPDATRLMVVSRATAGVGPISAGNGMMTVTHTFAADDGTLLDEHRHSQGVGASWPRDMIVSRDGSRVFVIADDRPFDRPHRAASTIVFDTARMALVPPTPQEPEGGAALAGVRTTHHLFPLP